MLKSFMLNQEQGCVQILRPLVEVRSLLYWCREPILFFFLSYFWHVETFFLFFFIIHPFYPFLVLMWDCVTGPAL